MVNRTARRLKNITPVLSPHSAHATRRSPTSRPSIRSSPMRGVSSRSRKRGGNERLHHSRSLHSSRFSIRLDLHQLSVFEGQRADRRELAVVDPGFAASAFVSRTAFPFHRRTCFPDHVVARHAEPQRVERLGLRL